jgi:hypothetical protein
MVRMGRHCQGAARSQCRNSSLASPGPQANRNYSIAHFHLAAALARLGELDEARAAVQAGLALDPSFTIRRFREATNARTDNPTYRAGRERVIEGMRMAGVPEG